MNEASNPESHTWSRRWQALLPALGFDLNRGRFSLRRGRLHSLEVRPGAVAATLEEPDRGACEIEVLLPVLHDGVWERILDALSDQALFAAQLLAGELPQSVDEQFRSAGASLLPEDRREVESRCSCCAEWELPCKHVNAALYALGQMLDEDPWILFRLRGRTRQQVLQALRARRSDAPDLSLSATASSEDGPAPGFAGLGHGDPGVALSTQIDDFWGRGRKLDRLQHTIAPPAIPLAILRRLGHPPFSQGSLETYDTLVHIYETVSQAALDLAFAPEPEE